ncbi:hypothetical protein ABVK25_008613 [Lepraria finkii]|uniref:Uncharacterized protein n=1 Tax=Lepraria finkii TaxID=1340010 RepID=A0ABR4B2U3_9LECA
MIGIVAIVISVVAGAITFTGFRHSEMPTSDFLKKKPSHGRFGNSFMRIAVVLNGGYPVSHYEGPTQADGTAPLCHHLQQRLRVHRRKLRYLPPSYFLRRLYPQ